MNEVENAQGSQGSESTLDQVLNTISQIAGEDNNNNQVPPKLTGAVTPAPSPQAAKPLSSMDPGDASSIQQTLSAIASVARKWTLKRRKNFLKLFET